jgi:hypothetical protein
MCRFRYTPAVYNRLFLTFVFCDNLRAYDFFFFNVYLLFVLSRTGVGFRFRHTVVLFKHLCKPRSELAEAHNYNAIRSVMISEPPTKITCTYVQ